MNTTANVNAVLVVEFSTGWGIFCTESRAAIATVYDDLEAVVDRCNREEWLVVEWRR